MKEEVQQSEGGNASLGGKMLKMGPEQGLPVKRRGKTPVRWLVLVILEICGSRKATNLKEIWAIL